MSQRSLPPDGLLRRRFSAAALLSAAAPSLAGIGALALPQQARAAAAAIGQPAPEFSAVDATGKTHHLRNFIGKTVVLEWTNPGCPFVRKHYSGNMQALQKEFTGQGVVWLAVNSTEAGSADYLEPAKLARWMAEKAAAPTATLMDESGGIGQLYGAKTTPQMAIISPAGLLLYSGAIDSIASAKVEDIQSATNHVRQALAETLAGKPVSTPLTRPYGCSVKYKAVKVSGQFPACPNCY